MKKCTVGLLRLDAATLFPEMKGDALNIGWRS